MLHAIFAPACWKLGSASCRIGTMVAKKPARQRRGRPPRVAAPVPRSPSTRPARATFEAIVTAAERVLIADGIDGLTTNRVAEIAGVGIGSVYQYFPNKHAIVAALFERYLDVFAAAFEEVVAGSSSLGEAAGKLALRILGLYESQPRIYGQLWRLRTVANAHDRIAQSHARMIASVEALIRRSSVAPELDPRTLAFMLVHAGDGIANAVGNAAEGIDAKQVAFMFGQLVQRIDRAAS
jgi:AcrR family transcriptional regulator